MRYLRSNTVDLGIWGLAHSFPPFFGGGGLFMFWLEPELFRQTKVDRPATNISQFLTPWKSRPPPWLQNCNLCAAALHKQFIIWQLSLHVLCNCTCTDNHKIFILMMTIYDHHVDGAADWMTKRLIFVDCWVVELAWFCLHYLAIVLFIPSPTIYCSWRQGCSVVSKCHCLY